MPRLYMLNIFNMLLLLLIYTFRLCLVKLLRPKNIDVFFILYLYIFFRYLLSIKFFICIYYIMVTLK